MKNLIQPASILLILLSFMLFACRPEPVPKPRGYFRIDFPEKNYARYDARCPFSMEVPIYTKIELIRGDAVDSCWFNLSFPRYKAKIHFTYLGVDNNLDEYLENAYQFAFKHEMKANSINRSQYNHPENKVSGLIYDLTGDVATSLQFYVTDSVDHFLRGALYFNNKPNPDSIAPALSFIREDVMHLLNSISWRDE